jgi:DNA topoisomerase-1
VALPATNPFTAAKIAGLRYVSDRTPGIRRAGTGKTFRYYLPDGGLIRDRNALVRIRSLAIPPAWTDVWICPVENGHIQATGRDARKRKQYRYHQRWREVRDETKFYRMIDFAKLLPRVRARVRRDLKLPGLPKDKVLATIVKLLETTNMRVGNEEYSKQNDSYGMTTLRDRHVNITRTHVHFYFRGKSGKKHAISITDPHLAKVVQRLRDLPGYELFQYVDEDGQRRSIGSADVNDYIREITAEDFTAKDFRTWAGTVYAIDALCACQPFTTQRQAKRNILNAVKQVAERLGNTAAVCRKAYIHPGVFDAYIQRALAPAKGSSKEKHLARMLKKWSVPKKKLTLEQALTKSVKSVNAGRSSKMKPTHAQSRSRFYL